MASQFQEPNSEKAIGTSQEHYKYYISNIDKEIKREYLHEHCIIPYWMPFLQGKRVLELGGGPGYFSRYVQKHCTLISTDLSFAFLQEAKSRYAITSVEADICHLPFPDASFDTIIVSGVFVYLNNEKFRTVLQESKRVLKRGGVLLFHEPLEYVRWFKTYLRLFFLDSLEPFFSKLYFSLAKMRGLAETPPSSHSLKIPSLYLRTKKEYASLLLEEEFTKITFRPTFINLAPPRIEKYFFGITFFLAPFFTFLRAEVNNGLLGAARKPSSS